jgi:Raf kinase inhibitor-like YbhB/YbcL family protein
LYIFEDMELSSSKFDISQPWIPNRYTCDGDNVSPPFNIKGVPAGAASLVLIMDDLDLPGGVMPHWLVWNIPPSTSEIKKNSLPEGSVIGKNKFGNNGYNGPCPPENSTHRYRFRLFALDSELKLAKESQQSDIEKTMHDHILDQAQLIGSYTRNSIEIQHAEEIVSGDFTSDESAGGS